MLPDLHGFLHDLRHSVLSGQIASDDAFDAACDRFFTAATMDQIDSVVPGWTAMSSYGEGVTLRHTARALVALLDLTEYQTASAREQHVMEWMVLVHDIAKEPRHGMRDHRHAFRSAAQAGIVLPRAGFQVTDAYAAEFDAWYRLTDGAHRFDVELETAVQDNSKLPEIVRGIDRMFGHDAANAIKAIAFHLSVTVVSEWPAPVPLSPAEERDYMSAELLPVLAVMWLADSGGWELFDREALEAMYDETRAVVRRLASF